MYFYQIQKQKQISLALKISRKIKSEGRFKIYTAFSLIKDTQLSLIKVVLCPPITAALKYKIILTMKTCCYKELVPS